MNTINNLLIKGIIIIDNIIYLTKANTYLNFRSSSNMR